MHGVQFRTGGVTISHLFFADDSVLFCRALEEEAFCLLEVLEDYAAGTDAQRDCEGSS